MEEATVQIYGRMLTLFQCKEYPQWVLLEHPPMLLRRVVAMKRVHDGQECCHLHGLVVHWRQERNKNCCPHASLPLRQIRCKSQPRRFCCRASSAFPTQSVHWTSKHATAKRTAGHVGEYRGDEAARTAGICHQDVLTSSSISALNARISSAILPDCHR